MWSIAILFSVSMLGLAQPLLIPQPAEWSARPGRFKLKRGQAIESVLRVEVAQEAGDDESYELIIDANEAVLRAPSRLGALRGMATFRQAVDESGSAPGMLVRDRPRFGWRGLLLDVARHFMPMPSVRRTIDGMAAVKLNVLHLHLTDDQGFRIESKRWPRLHSREHFTQAEMRELIAYAGERGIKIIPEFDLPGHATSWLAGYPELGSAPGPYEAERRFGVFDPTFDPTNERAYEFLDAFFAEMATVFPEPYVHIGGDEVTGKHWDANPGIREYRKARNWDNHALQRYFTNRLTELLKRHGRRAIVWDEALSEDLAPDALVQAWRGRNALFQSVFAKRPTIVSFGFYLDWMLPAEHAWRNDLTGRAVYPDDRMERLFARQVKAPEPREQLLPREQALVIGGEACMWSEMITPRNLDRRLWPRLGAVAERLWSPAELSDVSALYRRLEFLDAHLERLGLEVPTNFPEPLATVAEVLEPARYVSRILSRKYTTDSPLDALADRIRAESFPARKFAADVAARRQGRMRNSLERWRKAAQRLQADKTAPPDQRAAARDVAEVCDIGLRAQARRVRPSEVPALRKRLSEVSANDRELRVAIAPSIDLLFQ